MRTQNSASKLVELAIKRGELSRGEQCQICGKKPHSNGDVHTIVGHHWKGYDYPLLVWWICRSCNRFLLVHDGSLCLEEARVYVKKKQWAKLGYLLSDERARELVCSVKNT